MRGQWSCELLYDSESRSPPKKTIHQLNKKKKQKRESQSSLPSDSISVPNKRDKWDPQPVKQVLGDYGRLDNMKFALRFKSSFS